MIDADLCHVCVYVSGLLHAIAPKTVGRPCWFPHQSQRRIFQKKTFKMGLLPKKHRYPRNPVVGSYSGSKWLGRQATCSMIFSHTSPGFSQTRLWESRGAFGRAPMRSTRPPRKSYPSQLGTKPDRWPQVRCSMLCQMRKIRSPGEWSHVWGPKTQRSLARGCTFCHQEWGRNLVEHTYCI